MESQDQLKKHLIDFIERPNTHASFADAVANFPADLINKKIAGIPHTGWQLLEHIRRTQNDMVDFAHNPEYKEKHWPKDYWPDPNEQADEKMWKQSIAGFEKDFETMKTVIKDPKTDLFAKISWGQGQTVLREVLQVIDHNGYHIGELILLRRALGAWEI